MPSKQGFGVEKGNVGFQIGTADFDSEASKSSALGRVRDKATAKSPFQEVDLELIKA